MAESDKEKPGFIRRLLQPSARWPDLALVAAGASGEKTFTAGKQYTFGVALQGAKQEAAAHWVLLPMTFSLNSKDSDFISAQQNSGSAGINAMKSMPAKVSLRQQSALPVRRLAALAATLWLMLAPWTLAEQTPDQDEAANCMSCHAASADKPVLAIMHTVHGRIGEGGNSSCTSCHGASIKHSKSPVVHAPMVSFGPRWPSTAQRRDGACLECHQSGKQLLWHGSVHNDEDITCNQCHTLHTREDAVLDEMEQSAVCYQCHPRQRSESQLPSRHPIKEGRTQCSDCHNSHGSATPFALNAPTLNDTCYGCHAEKRGPYLFEHAPAAEDCSLCHQPHGSINDDLLKARGPFLCQQCHSAAFHPSTLYSGTGLPGADANQNMLGKNCLNCHSQVHGSNHPSGAVLTR
jgi:DmsE family decaheme c-type cytochrome